MFSKITIAVALSVIANLAVANPVRRHAIHRRQVILDEKETPWYCKVLGNETGAFLYDAKDLSNDCRDAGLGDHCCMTVMTQGPKEPLSVKDRNDLMATIAGQSKKEGRFDRTTYGDWTATFDTIVFADNDLVKSEILQVWFKVIKEIDLSKTAGFGNVILQIKDGTDDISNYMVVTRKDTQA